MLYFGNINRIAVHQSHLNVHFVVVQLLEYRYERIHESPQFGLFWRGVHLWLLQLPHIRLYLVGTLKCDALFLPLWALWLNIHLRVRFVERAHARLLLLIEDAIKRCHAFLEPCILNF
jgi:hypothetical protein